MATSIRESLEKNIGSLNRMGYAVDYSVSLTGLYNPIERKEIIASNVGDSALNNASSLSHAEYYGTLLSSGSVYGAVVNGFVEDDELQQAICILKPYYNFPIQYNSGQGTEQYNVVVNTLSNLHVQNGYSTCGTGITIPNSLIGEHYKKYDMSEDFVIGAGIDLITFGRRYFEHFYSNKGWDLEPVIRKLKILAERKLLFAEVTLDIAGGKILNIPIINSIDDPKSNSNDPSKILSHFWIPCPLMLLRDYSTLGTILINNPKGEVISVNDSEKNVTFPFENSTYDHKEAIIKGLNLNYYSNITNSSGDHLKNLQYVGTTWGIGGTEPDKKARVRLYFSDDRRKEVETIIGYVPPSCDSIFGPLNKISTKKLYDVSKSFNYDGMSEIYYEDGKYNNLNKDIYIKGLRLIWCYEVGNPNGDASYFEFVRGESWPSYGSFQAVERPDKNIYNISKIIDIYEQICIDSGNPYEESLIKEARKEMSTFKRTGSCSGEPFKMLGKDGRMFYAQTKQFWIEKLKPAMELYQSLNFNSAFGLYYCMDCINNGWKKKLFYGNPEVKNAQNENERVIKAIDLRERYLRSLSNWSKYGIRSNGTKGGWATKLIEWRENTLGGNYNLTRKCKWNGKMV